MMEVVRILSISVGCNLSMIEIGGESIIMGDGLTILVLVEVEFIIVGDSPIMGNDSTTIEVDLIITEGESLIMDNDSITIGLVITVDDLELV